MISHSGMKRNALAIAIGLALATGLTACGGNDSDVQAAASTVTAAEVRSVSLLDKMEWRFIQNDSLTDAAALADSATSWTRVSLPHSWNENDAATTVQTNPDSKDYKRGRGWYRLDFDHPANGSTQWLHFDGASIVADVWLNGEKLGQHKGAFTAFRFDVTGKLKAGRNTLIVKTDNSQPRTNTDPTAIAPLSGDFNMSGGLYRSVSLISTPGAAHFSLDDFGSSGIYATTSALNGNNAVVSVRAKVRNATSADASYTVQASLLEADGVTPKKTVQKVVALKAGTTADVMNDMEVSQARLWQGLADPYLYKLVVELKDGAGTTIDKVIQDFGIRQMHFDPNKGFFLNGKATPLHGVNMHQDFQGKSWAITKAETDASFALIKEIGANTLRLAHYPHAQYTLQQADKLGLVVMAEVPFVNNSTIASGSNCPVVDPETTGFGANVRQQAQELIRQQYNHASIGLWSIGNETTTLGIRCGNTDANNNVQSVLRSLQALAKQEDPSRLTTLADQITRNGDTVLPSPINVTNIADTYSVNRYFQWYYGTSETALATHLDDLHAQLPRTPIGVSEYGAGSGLTHHTDNPHGGRVCSRDATNASRICYQPEEYANYVHEKNYAAMVGKEYLYGTYVWNMFDFGSGIRHEGDIGATNTKGLVTFDRKTRKDAFYFYKANWTKEPVTYITARRYTERAYPVTDIKVYHNGESVSLNVNGATVGTMTAAQCALKVCEFKNVPLRAGANAISVQGTHSGRIVTDSANWNLNADNAENIYIAAGQLASGFVSNDALLGNHRYGSDNFFSGGTPVTLNPTTAIGGIGSTVPEEGRVWDAYREGASFSYEVPLANGSYRVTLGLLEPTATSAGARVFTVDANGVKAADVDVFARAGARNTATSASFATTVTGGKLRLDFRGVTGNAIVSNIAITRQ
ncbi:glycoside hydrolase family 2 TIM barrel-domain containing protein [Noviherbaspirillum aerium]|uniref:glycoside hydrolase family 2 TIM barrel-domain containing protein n=1 Tax=Noviherbaspirillum aerium TaxID=2588497 RepID=UPI00124F23A5|nr:glycoside hydrolase family 2 TIM barrel-domain containing protein [Noviherbaspirillum aerium]